MGDGDMPTGIRKVISCLVVIGFHLQILGDGILLLAYYLVPAILSAVRGLDFGSI